MEKSTPTKIVFSLFLGFTPVTILNQLQSYHRTLTSSRLDALWHLVGQVADSYDSAADLYQRVFADSRMETARLLAASDRFRMVYHLVI